MDKREIAALSAFAAIVERRSFARAAAYLGVTPSALSQTLRGLEDRLGVRLVHRTTRSVAPSEAGARLLATIAPLLTELDGALAAAKTADDRAAGTVRVSLSRIAGEIAVAPRLGQLAREYPDVAVELVVDDRLVDIVAERFDAGVRLGERVERDMVAVPIGGKQRMVAVGAPAYFARHGRPRHPRDLVALRAVGNLMPRGELYRWELERGGRAYEITPPTALASNDPSLVLAGALAGAGIAYAFEAQIAPHVAVGALEVVLGAWSPAFAGFYLYYPSRRLLTRAMRAFVDVMKR